MAQMAAMAGTLLGGVVHARGAIEDAQTNYIVSEYNARAAEESAAQVRSQAAEEERRIRVQGQKALGDAEAAYGASGVIASGSVVDVLRDNARTIEMDALNVRRAGEIEARSFEADARLSRYGAKRGLQAGHLGAAASLLGAGARASQFIRTRGDS